MASPAFIWILGALTAACGIALLVMLVRRRRAQIQLRTRRARRPIDAYAIPIALPAPSGPPVEAVADADDDLAKICPACGSRYGHQFRTCARDNSELAALN